MWKPDVHNSVLSIHCSVFRSSSTGPCLLCQKQGLSSNPVCICFPIDGGWGSLYPYVPNNTWQYQPFNVSWSGRYKVIWRNFCNWHFSDDHEFRTSFICFLSLFSVNCILIPLTLLFFGFDIPTLLLPRVPNIQLVNVLSTLKYFLFSHLSILLSLNDQGITSIP